MHPSRPDADRPHPGHGLPDDVPAGHLHALARVAATVCGVPVAGITLVDGHRYGVGSPDPAGQLTASVALTLTDGRVLGSLAVAGDPPGSLSPAQLAALGDLAAQAVALVEHAGQARDAAAHTAVLRLAAEGSADVVSRHDLDGTTRWVSPSVRAVLGVRPEDVLGRRAATGVHPEDQPALAAGVRRLLHRHEDAATVLVRRAHADGSWRWLEAGLAPLRDENGALTGIHSVARDVTARVQAERARADAEERFRGLVEEGPDGILVHVEGYVAYANPAAARLVGADGARDLLGLPVSALTDPDLATPLRAHIRQTLLGRDAGLLRQRLRRRDGGWCTVDLSSARVALDGRIGVQHVVRAVRPLEAAPEPAAPSGGRQRLRVLVADDSDISLMVARALLAAEDAEVVTVTDGDQAVDAVARNGFDLVLLDVRMPRMSGPDAARAIRALPGGAGRTPLLALTAATGDDDRAECLAAGMGGVLVKPVRRAQLRQVLTEVGG